MSSIVRRLKQDFWNWGTHIQSRETDEQLENGMGWESSLLKRQGARGAATTFCILASCSVFGIALHCWEKSASIDRPILGGKDL